MLLLTDPQQLETYLNILINSSERYKKALSRARNKQNLDNNLPSYA